MKRNLFFLCPASAILILFFGVPSLAADDHESSSIVPAIALKKLKEGNSRYSESLSVHPNLSMERRHETAGGQHPFAIILSCADSRVPPELVFDQGVGDLFVVRVAGNVVNDHVLGSIEYAVEHLGSSLIVVMGHEKCGAVKAAMDGGEAPGHIGSLIEAIQPVLERKRFDDSGETKLELDDVVRGNVERVAWQLKTSEPILTEFIKEGKLAVVGARYDLDDGNVEFIQAEHLEDAFHAEPITPKE